MPAGRASRKGGASAGRGVAPALVGRANEVLAVLF